MFEETLGLDGAGFVVDPNVDGEGNRVALEAKIGKKEGDEFGDLEVDSIRVGEFCSTGADDNCVAKRLGDLGKAGEKCWLCGPGFIEVDGDGERFHLNSF